MVKFYLKDESIMQKDNAEKSYVTDEKSLLWEFVFTLREYFNMTAVQSGGSALIALENGQTFVLTLRPAQ